MAPEGPASPVGKAWRDCRSSLNFGYWFAWKAAVLNPR
jgi:hypothetical protein